MFEVSSPFPGESAGPSRLFFNRSQVLRFSSFEKTSSSGRLRPHLFFDKSLVCRVSSLEKPHQPGWLPHLALIFRQKPGTQLLFFRKAWSSARPSSEATGLIGNMDLYRHGCSAFADWLRPISACGI